MSHDPITTSSASLDLSASNYLTVIAGRIKAEHEAVAASLKQSVQHAIAAGELLIEAKDKVPHGQWLPWLSDHCGVSPRSAQGYMRLARHRAELEANTQALSHLTIEEALAGLAKPKALPPPQDMMDDAIVDRIMTKNAEIKRALKEFAESIDTCDDLKFLAFLATDDTQINLAVEHRMNAERELGKLLNEQKERASSLPNMIIDPEFSTLLPAHKPVELEYLEKIS